MARRTMAAVAFLGLATLAVVAVPGGFSADKEEGWTKLFNGKDLTGWKTFLGRAGDPEKIFKVEDGVLIVEGSIPGYVITDKDYENYVLRLQWRWGEKAARGRNSGVFVHVSGPDKIWPKGVEAQLMSGNAGDIWLVGDPVFKLTVDADRRDPRVPRHFFRLKKEEKVEKPVGEWNQYEIVCDGDKIKLSVNGQFVNEGTGAESTKGKILLQSEGAEIHFRNVELKPLR